LDSSSFLSVGSVPCSLDLIVNGHLEVFLHHNIVVVDLLFVAEDHLLATPFVNLVGSLTPCGIIPTIVEKLPKDFPLIIGVGTSLILLLIGHWWSLDVALAVLLLMPLLGFVNLVVEILVHW
jgi:hypothetical protein